MDIEELRVTLEKHKLWLAGDINGKKANLRNADLHGMDIIRANLSMADLRGAEMQGTIMIGANLSWACMRGVDLSKANLCCANLQSANLHSANLCEADMRGTDMRGTDVRKADLSGAKNVPFLPQTIICPEEGSFIGFKKVNGLIVKLEIPAEAKRSSATTRKCRCEFAKVISITNIDGTPYDVDVIKNSSFEHCIYAIGKITQADSFDDDRWNECTHGIHFFITRQEAVDYGW